MRTKSEKGFIYRTLSRFKLNSNLLSLISILPILAVRIQKLLSVDKNLFLRMANDETISGGKTLKSNILLEDL